MDTTEHKDRPFTVSVVIPTYNIGKLVARAIDSVLAQTHQPDEIIVVDDGSTDDTADVIKSYGPKVKYIYQDNLGLAGARNTGIKAATCEWVAFLDGDDEWLPDNLRLHLEVLKRNQDLVWSAGNFDNFLAGENRRRPYVRPEKGLKLLGGKDYFDDFFDAYMNDAAGNANTMVIKRQILHEAGLFRQELPFAEDTDMWFRMAMQWPQIGFVPQPVAVYHLHRPGSLMDFTQSTKRLEVICDIVERSLALAKEHNRMDKFAPCAGFLLRRIIRSSLFEYRMAELVKDMVRRFDTFLSPGYKKRILFLVQSPRVTAFVLHAVSRIVRVFNLRRRVVRPPRRSG
jgi:glycosyltransferase involved in cell wall biosynthesis